LLMNVSMSAGSSELAMSISEVRIIIWWMYLPMTIALRICNLGWLTYYAIALHMFQSVIWTLTHCHISNDGSAGIYTTRFLSTNQILLLDDLSKISSLLTLLLPLIMLVKLISGTLVIV
jgi:hypothetical protein